MKQQFLGAANWVLSNQLKNIDCGIKTIKYDDYVLFNAKKDLMYKGFTNDHQFCLKGLICKVIDNVAVDIIAGCFSKFFNYGEPDEKLMYQKYLGTENQVLFITKMDGVNVRSWWCEATNSIEWATRGTLFGKNDQEETNDYLDYGQYAKKIAEKYSSITPELVKRYSLIFELIHPDCKIITDYGSMQELILLSVMDLQDDCRELSYNELYMFARNNGFLLPQICLITDNNVNIPDNWEYYLNLLQSKWSKTDKESAVIAFCDADSNFLYRLKFKNHDYIAYLRALKNCNIKWVINACLENNLREWVVFKEFIYKTAFVNEECEPKFQELFAEAQKYMARLDEIKAVILSSYLAIPTFATRKEFALHIVNEPFKQFYFGMKNLSEKNMNPELIWRVVKNTMNLAELNPYTESE